MPSAQMNRLMDNARVRLPGALDTAIQAELFSTINEFCRKTNAWQATFDIDVVPTQLTFNEDPDAYTYQIFPPTGATSVRLLGIGDPNGSPIVGAMYVPNYIQLRRSPNAAEVYGVRVSLTVVDPVTRAGEPVVPGWIVEKYNDVLLDGVLYRMMSQAAKPYTNIQVGEFHARSFKSGVSTARIELGRGNIYTGTAWRYPQTHATHRR